MGKDKLPAVVLLHGSSGISGFVDDWAQFINGMGVATFVLDSFTARGIESLNNDQSRLSRLATTVDAYRALELLAKHPRIDPERIVVMGFSRGGQAALYAAMKRFQRLHGPEGKGFAGYLVFYPDCRTRYREDEDLADRPIRILHGNADDYNPVDACRDYVQSLRKAGKKVQLIEYAGAAHVFDWVMLKEPRKLTKAQTTRNCRLEERDNGVLFNSRSGQPLRMRTLASSTGRRLPITPTHTRPRRRMCASSSSPRSSCRWRVSTDGAWQQGAFGGKSWSAKPKPGWKRRSCSATRR